VQPAFEKAALAVIGRQRNRSSIARRRFYGPSEPAQEIGPRRMKKMVAVQIAGLGQRVDERERGFRSVHHGDRHCAVQRHDGRGLHPLEHIVEPDDLRPVRLFGAGRLTMQRRDRRLQRERAGPAA
jgi:hypothetical protein